MNLNTYQKIQILLLVSIVIAFIVFIISIVKTKNLENYTTEETFSDMTAVINEIPEEPFIQEDTSWDEENVEDTEVDMTDEENAEEKNTATYYIKVNYTANVVTIYTKDSSGQYTKPVKAMVCSTGTATPRSGVYKMSDKYRWHELNGGVYGQYCSRITGHILFHSVPYVTNSPDTLKYAAYDKLGTAASAGCIRLTVADALWIYSNCPSGTYVEFYSSTNPGPLGKPTAKKISSNVACRNWDPTDPLSNNPWHSYVEPASTQVEKPSGETESDHPKEENKQEENSSNNNVDNGNQENNNNQNNDNQNNNNQDNNNQDNNNQNNNNQDNTENNENNKPDVPEGDQNENNNENDNHQNDKEEESSTQKPDETKPSTNQDTNLKT